jgi:predicted Holliday junction resolvase-like endonuclease
MSPVPVVLLVLAILALATLIALALLLGLVIGRRSGRFEFERGLAKRLAAERDDAVKRSRAVLGGQLSEQIAPFLPGFPFDPSEVRFVGKPVDFVAFVGASSGRIQELVLVEVKSGGAGLSPVERSLREAVEAGRVRFVEYRVPR